MKNKAFTLIELLIVVAILSLILALCGALLGGCSRSDGVRTGTVTKFSYKGFIGAKSWEGEMAMGGMRSADHGVQANVWQFSVLGSKNNEIAEKINKLIGKPVKLTYRESFMRNPLRQDTRHVVTAVEEIDPKAER